MSSGDGGDHPENEPQSESRRGAVIGLIVVLVLGVIAYYLVVALREEGQREDCLMAGRKNCAPIELPARE